MTDPKNDPQASDAETPDLQEPVDEATETVIEGLEPEADDPIEPLRAEIADLKDKLLRQMAETENVRRRAQRDREDATNYAATKFARDILSVADNLRRALDVVPADQAEDPFIKNLLTGIEATERELLGVFERNGIKKLEPLDEPFDPNFHEVMFEQPGTGKPSGTVVQLLQTGYMIKDRLLRPARVAVAKGEPGEHVDTEA